MLLVRDDVPKQPGQKQKNRVNLAPMGLAPTDMASAESGTTFGILQNKATERRRIGFRERLPSESALWRCFYGDVFAEQSQCGMPKTFDEVQPRRP